MRAALTMNRIVFSFCFLLHFSSGGSSQAQQINDENQQIKYCRLSSQHTLCKFQVKDTIFNSSRLNSYYYYYYFLSFFNNES